MEKRRQNHSCEECRKSKKACDGHVVNSALSHLRTQGSEYSTHPRKDERPAEGSCAQDVNVIMPCSYCLRTKKNCSLNPQWAQAHQSNDRQDDGQPQAKRQQRFKPPKENTSPDSLVPTIMDSDLDSLGQLFQTTSQSSDVLGWDLQIAAPPLDAIVPPSIGPTNLSEESPGYQDLDCFMDPAMTDCGSVPSSLNTESTIFDSPRVFPMHRSSMSSISAPWEGRKKKPWREHEGNRRLKGYRDSRSLQEYCETSLSPFDVDHTAMTETNKSLISDSLLRIYHDVLENNLGCWLAEDTCPYQMQRRRHELVPIQQRPDPGAQSRLEWGGTWSNRMYRRVKWLDRVAQSAKLIRLTALENQAASRALDLVIMAFATQWRQGNQSRASGCEDETDGDEFEQTLQQTIWEQARKALQEVSDLECYRVVFAELIFGLIQKPWSGREYDECTTGGSRMTGNQDRSVRSSILPQVMDILVQDGPPVFMERAARKIHALKFQYEAREVGFQEALRTCSVPQRFSIEDKQTVGLLYWLAVMFDTLSASMNERPVVIPDEECQHDAVKEEAADDYTQRSRRDRRWKLDLYAQDDPEKPFPLSWPCPYEAATRAIARSAAVKVLLFRHVSYLQNTLRNREHGQAVEDIIRITISVYRYWERTHGAFFRDLTRDYESIPPRIKSWFLCIAIPWHLGCLMLADLIGFVDENGLGLDTASARRLDTNMAVTMRRTSSVGLADLATATTPPPDMISSRMSLKKEQLPDFHFAVNESPLLTEPWTVLLIRAFTKASVFHLTEAEEEFRKLEWSVWGQESETLRASLARGESCVRALRFLGAKSGSAEAISKVLFQPFDSYKMRQESGFLSSQGLVF